MAAPLELAIEHRLHEGSQGETVACGDEVNRRAHEREPDGLAIGEEPAELCGGEVVQAGPESDVWRIRCLRLETDEPFDGVDGRKGVPAQQHLTREQGPVQCTSSYDAGAAGFRARGHVVQAWSTRIRGELRNDALRASMTKV